MPRTNYKLRLARTASELRAAQRLRYQIFINELGGDGPLVNHELGLEIDEFDERCEHLILLDLHENEEQVVGTCRLLLECDATNRKNGFYCEKEFDLTNIRATGRRLLEIGRTCLHEHHRGGTAMACLWSEIYRYVVENKVDLIFGAASLPGNDVDRLEPILSFLTGNYLAPTPLRTTSLQNGNKVIQFTSNQSNRVEIIKEIPSLIKAYLRLGGYVGQGVYIDHAFNLTDIFMLLDVSRIPNDKKRALKLTEH